MSLKIGTELNPKRVVNFNRIAWSVWSGLLGQFQPDFTSKRKSNVFISKERPKCNKTFN